MAFKKGVSCVIFLMVLGLLYVSQQVRIVELGYQIKGQEELLAQLLDQNKILVYNINSLSSPLKLDKNLLSRRLDLSFANEYRTVRLASNRSLRVPAAGNPVLGFLTNFFTPKAQAEASTIKANP